MKLGPSRASGLLLGALLALATGPAEAQTAEEGGAEEVLAPPPSAPMPTIPPSYERGSDLANPGTPPSDAPLEAERPPAFGGRVAAAPEPAVHDAHLMPIRLSERPLTLTEGTMRIDHGILLRTGGFGLIARMNVGLTVGFTEDVEVGLSWPIQGDPTLHAAGRLYRDDVLEIGVRGALMVPAITTGDTNARIGVPVLLHGGPVRFVVAAELDLLFTANVSVLLAFPAQLTVTAGRVFSFGAQGWFGLVDGVVPQGDLLGFMNFTAHNGNRALMDARISMGWAPAESDMIFTTSLSFYPQLW